MVLSASDEQQWGDEIRAAREYIGQFLEGWDEQRAQLTGSRYNSKESWGSDQLEPHLFEWVTTFLPQFASGAPQFWGESALDGEARLRAVATRYGLNRLSREAKWAELSEQCGTDLGLRWGVALTLPEPRPGALSEKWWSRTRRVSPPEFLFDYQADNWIDCRFKGHIGRRDKEDVLREARKDPDLGWRVEAIKALNTAAAHSRAERRTSSPVDRDQITFAEVWVPEIQPDPKLGPDQGYNGAWLTIGIEGTGESQSGWKFIRDPYPAFTRHQGPYHVVGGHYVPDELPALSPTIAVDRLVEDVNYYSASLEQATRNFKQGLVVSSKLKSLAAKILANPTGSVFTADEATVEALEKELAEYSVGGPTDPQIKATALARDRLDRASGFHDAIRGNVDGDATATAVSVAQGATAGKMGFLLGKWFGFFEDIAHANAWYMNVDDQVQQAFGPEAASEPLFQRGGKLITGIRGGIAEDSKETLAEVFEAVEAMAFEVIPQSLQGAAAEAQIRVATLDSTAEILARLAPAAPHVRWDQYLAQRAELTKQHGLRDLLDPLALREFQAITLQGQAPQQSNARPAPTPTLQGQPESVAQGSGASVPASAGALGGLVRGLSPKDVGQQEVPSA